MISMQILPVMIALKKVFLTWLLKICVTKTHAPGLMKKMVEKDFGQLPVTMTSKK